MTRYNDNDPFCAAWLRELIAAGHLPAGDVLAAPIESLTHEHLSSATTFHAFAGIGGWPLALALAGWPTDRPVWTGSCPCQPFSAAGKRLGAADKRHLWPAWFRLIRQCRPDTIFGEQVAGAIGHGWLDGISADLEAEGYAVGAVVLGAHSVGAPHIRQRLYWVAVSQSAGGWPNMGAIPSGSLARLREPQGQDSGWTERETGGISDSHANGRLADRIGSRLEGGEGQRTWEEREAAERGGGSGGMDDSSPYRRQHEPTLAGGAGAGTAARERGQQPRDGREPDGLALTQQPLGRPLGEHRQDERDGYDDRRAQTHGIAGARGEILNPWSLYTPHLCLDGKTRRIPLEPAFFPLADGFQPARVGKLRGAGNAIVPQAAAAFIRAFLGCERALTP